MSRPWKKEELDAYMVMKLSRDGILDGGADRVRVGLLAR